MAPSSFTEALPLPLVASGKVRDLYAIDDKTLLFVASDRISAYDAVLASPIPQKGALLTRLSAFWFSLLPSLLAEQRASSSSTTTTTPELHTHFLSLGLPPSLALKNDPSGAIAAALAPRSMQVRRLRIFPIEAIVRGYLTGSAWAEYSRAGTVHGIQLPAGLQLCQQLPAGSLFTPSTKAEAGAHDENIHPSQVAALVGGQHYAERIERLALAIYEAARLYAQSRGVIIADTKFEFGLDEETDEIVLVDEVLTPDSSRFWAADKYEVGREQDSFDKQPLRDWLTGEGLKGKAGVELPEAIVCETSDRYQDAYFKLTGVKFEESQVSGL